LTTPTREDKMITKNHLSDQEWGFAMLMRQELLLEEQTD
jgi:hypothetical protein